ncbi:MAG: glycosyltransferase family 1 protein [Candidatus Hydrogenedentota bacterium]
MMEVGIDIGPLTPARTGVGNYCYYLVKHLLRGGGELELKAFSTGLHRPDAKQFGERLFHRHIPVPTRAAYRVWETLHWPPVDTLLQGVDVYHATNFFLPPTASAKRVVTIHDLTFLAAPELCSPKIVGPFSRSIGRFAREADAILTYSKATTHDIVEQFGVPSEKVTVAPLAVDEDFQRLPRAEAQAHVKQEYGVSTPYLLFVGTIEPRKNVPTLLKAFATICRDIPHQLVLAGATGWNPEPFNRALAETNLGDRLKQTGYVRNHAELAAFYSAADLFAFPSYYEGFGLPVLEAMTCGCPVVAADNSAIPEVTGDAAVLLPADDADSWAETLKTLLENTGQRETLSEAGKRRAATFSWQDCAARTAEVYRSVATCG